MMNINDLTKILFGVILSMVMWSCADVKKKNISDNVISYPRVVNLGKVSSMQDIDTILTISNNSDNSLKIESVGVSCECLKINYFDSIIPSKTEGVIKIKIETQDLEGDFKRKLFLRNNSDKEVFVINIIGKV